MKIDELTTEDTGPAVGDVVMLEGGKMAFVGTIVSKDGDSITLEGDRYPFNEEEINENSMQLEESHLMRAHDLHPLEHVRDNYYLSSDVHDDGDSRKVTWVLYKKIVDTMDLLEPAYKFVAWLDKISSYARISHSDLMAAANEKLDSILRNPRIMRETEKKRRYYIVPKGSPASHIPSKGGFDTEAAAKATLTTMQDADKHTIRAMDTTKLKENYTPTDPFDHGKKSAEVSHKTDKKQEKNPHPKGSEEAKDWQRGWDSFKKSQVDEAEYHGRTVKLGKPMRGDVRKYKVFVKDPKTGNIKKVNFGDPNMEIKRDDPARRKNFRARHGCGTPRASNRTKAAYWSCRMWSSKPVSKILKGK